ncbi:hypothetical protein HOP52_18590 [Halomonas campisalis]|uniref:Uncharacterized protein n=1 Tax=Billgrantia campisalis TaxID=74661 RepID=A0ABS9PDB5_9GAMM|nr:hypothetical protein [Halomonas campisalis]MCG6659761.1 hypothetical protein [Halomonas campisalis]MDR5864918.1 hypothetical protein [Halomonas campisalis]
MPVMLDDLAATLRVSLPDAWDSPNWRVGHIAAAKLSVEGNARLRRLRIGVELFLLAEGDAAPCRLRGELVSASWSPLAPLPPVQQRLEGETPDLPAVASVPLPFTFAGLGAPVRVSGERSWLQYLHPIKAMVGAADSASEPMPLAESLQLALAEWLTHDFPVATLGEAIDTAMCGPVGHFGPLESRVLERSGQSDLAIEATWLGEVDNAAEQGGRATLALTLYGERFGAWVLHRRGMQPVKARPKQESGPAPVFAHEVLVADTADALIEQAGLGPVEKRLFQQVGILPHARLWQQVDEPEGGEPADEADPKSAMTLDLSALPDRGRRHLQAIAGLVRQGKLGPSDIDLLLKLARQLSRSAKK